MGGFFLTIREDADSSDVSKYRSNDLTVPHYPLK